MLPPAESTRLLESRFDDRFTASASALRCLVSSLTAAMHAIFTLLMVARKSSFPVWRVSINNDWTFELPPSRREAPYLTIRVRVRIRIRVTTVEERGAIPHSGNPHRLILVRN